MVDNFNEYFSSDPKEEQVFDYRPSIKYVPDEINTIDNTNRRPTEQSVDYSLITSISKKFINNNVIDLINEVSRKEQIVTALQADMAQHLLDLKFSVNVNAAMPTFYNDIIENGTISFQNYQLVPNTEDYRLIHDIWFKEAVSMRGNIVAECYPIISDIAGDILRIKNLISNLILYQTDLTIDTEETVLRKFILSKVEEYENIFGSIIDNQRKRNKEVISELSKRQKTLENELKLDTELNILFTSSTMMIDTPLQTVGKAIYNDIDGVTAEEAKKEIDEFTKKIEITEKSMQIPLLYGYKTVSNNIIKDRLSAVNQYSTEIKEDISKKILQIGRTWKNICTQDIANYLVLGYNDSKLLYYLTSGIADMNSQMIESLKDFYKVSLGEMNTRTKIEKEMVYKNMIRHIYNNYLAGGN